MFLFFAISLFVILAAPVEDIVTVERTDVIIPSETGQTLTFSRDLVERIHRAGGLRCPHALEFLVLEEHAEFGGLLIVVDDGQRVTLLEVIADKHIVLRLSLADFALDEIGEHFTGGHLIEAGGI